MARSNAKSNALNPDRLNRVKRELAERGAVLDAETGDSDASVSSQGQDTAQSGPAKRGRPRSTEEREPLMLRPLTDSVTALRVYAAAQRCTLAEVIDALIALHLEDADVLEAISKNKELKKSKYN